MVDHSTAILAEGIAVGFSGGPVWNTSALTSVSGHEQRNQMRAEPVHAYSFTGADQQRAGLLALKAFHMGRRGRLYSFLLKDWSDFSGTGEALGTGDGADVTFQIVKAYSSVNPWSRTIRHIKSGTLTVYANGVAVDPADYAQANGLVTFDTAPALGVVITADFEFYVPVRFQQDEFTINVSAASAQWGNTGALDCIEVLE